ncbi:hypothetical protein BGX23_012734, partial [Mortierella sp. AD031]
MEEMSSSSINPSSMPSSQSLGSKIRFPRHLLDMPDNFRKPASSQSHSSSSPSDTPYSSASSSTPRRSSGDVQPDYQQGLTLTLRSSDTTKRTYSDMLSGDNTHSKIYKRSKKKRPKTGRQKAGSSHITIRSPSISNPVASASTDTTVVSTVVLRATRSLTRSKSQQDPAAVIHPSPRKSPSKRKLAKVIDSTLTPPPTPKRHRTRSYSKSISPATSPTLASTPLPSPTSVDGNVSSRSNERNSSAPSCPPSPKDASSPPSSMTPPRDNAPLAFLATSQLLVGATIEGTSMPAGGTSVSAQPQGPLAQPASPSFQLPIQTPITSALVVAPTPTANSSVKRTEAENLFSPPLLTQPALSQPAAESLRPAISLDRSGLQELKRKRPVKESAPASQEDVQHVAKRRHSLATNEQDRPSTIASQADANAGSIHHPADPVHATSINQATVTPPTPIQETPVVSPTMITSLDPLPAAATVGYASTPASTVTAQSNDSGHGSDGSIRALTAHEEQMLRELKVIAGRSKCPTSAHGHFKRIYQVQDDDGIMVQNFKDMDAESFEGRVREMACLLKLRGLEGVGQIQTVIDDNEDYLVGLSMT